MSYHSCNVSKARANREQKKADSEREEEKKAPRRNEENKSQKLISFPLFLTEGFAPTSRNNNNTKVERSGSNKYCNQLDQKLRLPSRDSMSS